MKKYQVFLFFILVFSTIAKAQTGIFSELEKNQKKILKNYQRIFGKAKNLPLISKTDLKLDELHLSSEYLAWVFMNSDPSYVKLFRPKNLCRFAEMASNKLLKPTDLIIFRIDGKIENDDQNLEIKKKKIYGHFKLKQFISFLEKNNQCSNLKANSESFNNQNISTTISSYQLKKPSSEANCDDVINQILNDKMAPSFCGIAREIKDADLAIVELDVTALTIGAIRKNELNSIINRGAYIRDKVGNLNASLMSQICQNLNKPANFCAPHLREDIWTRAMSGEISPKKISTICSQLTKNNQMNKRVLERCASIANDMPSACIDIQLAKKTALFPVQDCGQLSRNLLLSNIVADYKDCPSKVENHSMINLQRIGSKVKEIHQKYKNNSCEEIPGKVYSNISYQYDSENWPLQICYFDPADADDLKICYQEGYVQKCLTYDPDAPLSHHQSSKSVLENILKKKFNDGLRVNCTFFEASEKDKYLYGSKENCLVFHKKNKCNLLKCPKTVLLNNKEVKEISFSERELRCMPYIPGNDEENEIAENKTVAKIIKRIYAAPNSTTCKIISEKSYNPIFLDYKQGCFVLTPNNCQTSNCKKRIIYNQKEFFNFSYRGELGENYFQVSTRDKSHSSNRKMKKILNLEDEKILSLTKIKSWFLKSKSIIHGISCLEDLYPMFFKRRSFNQCEAIPFIISGVKTENEREYVVIQTTLDSINYPRTIRWNSLYNSLKMYQLIHPQRVWALYGIK